MVGITTDVVEAAGGRLKADCGLAYARCVAAAGGLPVLLPAIPELAAEHLALCEGLVLTGGDDPRMEAFGAATHPAARPMHPLRQEYETALLELHEREGGGKPVLGVCLGMQMMALVNGAKLNQHLPDTLEGAERHRGVHRVFPAVDQTGRTSARWSQAIPAGESLSNHHQAVSDPGRLQVVATAEDGVIEAVARPERTFYLGVQWHPERTENRELGQGLFDRLVLAIRGVEKGQPPAPD